MKTNLSKIKGANVLSRENQSKIKGQGGVDLSLCGCSCSGAVTGPAYCHKYIACPQVHTC
ncbi:hypothetical protein [Aquimarina muelleri]|uniref:Natural product n=1 Tax=Aquimarina muelleri TaxID=279356 RepID=A0A918N3E2_9FLAO|nr:hypothetical protein [Aquimarina muelleri]MCX2761331.1 hypothetical protein [Aquimarina muelleri]GGX12614.1 hypothetical protein GCM10007384_13020 [Aquimarina muelleri]